MANMKRIHKVTIKHFVDTDPDTSWLGEYSSKSTSEYTIDREHSLDCPINTGETPLDSKTRTMAHAEIGSCECSDPGCPVHEGVSKCGQKSQTILYRIDMDDASGTLMCSDCADDATTTGVFQEGDDYELTEPQCNCGESGDRARNEYQYFNPSLNYVHTNGHRLLENSDADVRKYVKQDYERMESLNRGDWCFYGIRADAEISVPSGDAFIAQDVTSGGLWGVESDSDKGYFEEVEREQLAELRAQLHELGFSHRAILAAFKNVKHQDE